MDFLSGYGTKVGNTFQGRGLAHRRASGVRREKILSCQLARRDGLRSLAATIKARWICEQAHQQLKEELGLDHFEEGLAWSSSSCAHDHDRLRVPPTSPPHKVRREKKESTARRLNRRCGRSPPSSISSFDQALSDVRTAEPGIDAQQRVNESAKVVLGWAEALLLQSRHLYANVIRASETP